MATPCLTTPKLFDDYELDPVALSMRLLGQRLVRVMPGRSRQRFAGTIVEVEAYLGERDRAAHTYGGRRTRRNESMYLAGGHAYVYQIYGMHHCLNVVCGNEDEGVAVLIRAIEPTEGVDRIKRNRPNARRETDLCSGPGKLCQALAIDRTLDGHDLRRGEWLFIELVHPAMLPASRIERTPRIGVAYAGPWAAEPLRFCLAGNPHVSRR
jgi:DNA-3-methyladenine glycosylase